MSTVNQGKPRKSFEGSAYDAVAVTPHDSTNFAEGTAKALYVGTSGNITLITAAGKTALFANVPIGFFPVQCSRVNATGTAATDILALY